MSDSLRPHGLQHARLPCPSPTPGAYTNSCPLSWWCNHLILCHPLLLPPSILPSISLIKWVSSPHQVAKVLEFQLQHQSFQWIFRFDFLYDWPVWSPCSPRDSQESSPTPQFKSINPLLLPPSIFPSIRVFSNESVLHIMWPKYWSFSFSISPSNEYSGLISFRTDRFDLLAVPLYLYAFVWAAFSINKTLPS